jgi:predicted transcriptional regulator
MSRNDRGEYTSKATDEAILAHFSRTDRPFQTAQSVAEQFDLDRSQAYRRLQQLAENGVLEKEKVGGRAAVWWLATDAPDVEERDPEDILGALETFLEERDAPEPPLPSTDAVREDYHARRHRENLERLAVEDEPRE